MGEWRSRKRTPDRCVQIRLMHAYAFSIAEKTATTAARTLKKMQERTILRGNHQSSQRHGKERGGTRPQLPKPIPRLPAEWLACRLVLQHVVSRSVNVSPGKSETYRLLPPMSLSRTYSAA